MGAATVASTSALNRSARRIGLEVRTDVRRDLPGRQLSLREERKERERRDSNPRPPA
jgi:hypothetical protein